MSVYPGVCGGYGIPGPPGPPGPAGGDVGGRINVPPQLVPRTPAVISILAAPGFTGATVTGSVFTSPTDSMWEFSGFLDMSTDVAEPGYIIDVDCWLIYNDVSGVQVTSEMSTSSGHLSSTANYRAPVSLTAAIPAGRPVQIVVQTFGRDADLSVRMFGGFAAARLIAGTPPTAVTLANTSDEPESVATLRALLPVDDGDEELGRPWKATLGSVPIPSQGTDTYMIWTGDYRTGDTYKRGCAVSHEGNIWTARVDRPPGAPGLLDSGWDLLSPRVPIKGAAYNFAQVVTQDGVPIMMPPLSVNLMVGVHLSNNVIILDTPGTWLIAGTIRVSSDLAEPQNYTIDTWVEWTNSAGEKRTTPKSTNNGDAGAESSFTNRFDFTAIFEDVTELRVFCETLEIEGDPAILTGFLSASLLMERNL